MKDSYGRTIDYMRISITDRCNLRCKYCMPYGVESVSHQDILTFEEIRKVVLCGAKLGIRHIKVTGGEPLVRKGCCAFIRMLKAVPGIEHVTLTTNGILLGEYLEELIQSGIDGINISLDTMDREWYRQITGRDGLEEVLGIVKRAASLPVPLKINAVSVDWGKMFRAVSGDGERMVCAVSGDGERMIPTVSADGERMIPTISADGETVSGVGGVCAEEEELGRRGRERGKADEEREIGENWKALVLLAKRYPIDVRFIEMMPIGCGKGYPAISHEKLLAKMMQEFPGMRREKEMYSAGEGGSSNAHGFGPAVYYRIPGFLGSIGLISAIHGKFCADCNRVRLTAQGYLKTCLCFSDGVDLRAILRGECKDGVEFGEELTAAMREAIGRKPAAHCFEEPEKMTEQRAMVDIGG